ncbi:MAG: hypothetical protein IJN20_01105 [Oscillospiraceae bacterium]|nr:hypothetical protein [Oscillospiraceae bacterium]
MKFCKKIMAVLVMLCLFANMIPAVAAVDTEVRLSSATDYSELKKQVAIANELNVYDYTIQTWKPLKDALKKGTDLLKGSHGQKTVNDAVAALKKAISGLEKMDYSKLDAVLADINNEIEKDQVRYNLWHRVNAAIETARPRLVSGNQELVDLSVKELQALLEEMQQSAQKAQEPEVVIEEVEVEVLPTSDYCNIPMHHTWPILFVVSAVLNVALIVLLIYVIMKKRQTMDNTPLVSYDIDDDMDY